MLKRRSFLKGAAAGAAVLAAPRLGAQAGRTMSFSPIRLRTASEDSLAVAEGYTAFVLLRWGDPLTSDVPEFDVMRQTPEAQARQVGYNCDYLAFFPLPGADPNSSGVLAVNHETSAGALMFPNYVAANATRQQVDIEMASMGMSMVEIRRVGACGSMCAARGTTGA